MANILIIDNQAWILALCREGLAGEGYRFSATDDVNDVRKSVLSFSPNLILLSLYLKHGCVAWEVLRDIKTQYPSLPVIIVAEYDAHLFSPHLSEADGYLSRSQTAADELKHKISELLDSKPAPPENTTSPPIKSLSMGT